MSEVIVVGAGVLGASTAYHLVKMGAKVTMVDAGFEGQATDAAAGIICPWLTQRRNKKWYTLAKNGAAYFSTLIPALEEDNDIDTGYKRVGAISIHTDSEKLKKMKERALNRREDAPEIGEVYQLDEMETAKLFPPIAEGYSSVYVSGGARVNGGALRDALVRVAKKHGARFVNGKAELIHQSSTIKGVKVNNEEIFADSVVITAGAWADQLFAPLGIELDLSFQKGQIVHLQLEQKNSDTWPVVMPPGNKSILAFDDGEIVIGSTHEKDKGFDMRVTAGGVYDILNQTLAVAPGLENAGIKDIRVGFRPYTPDFLPMFGKIPDFNGLYTANGLGASGLTVGPYLGFQLACLVLGKQLEIDQSNYDIASAIKNMD
ncbi:NAD(P)/FAD-dependent oxidoreductase [Pallidibacillus pasinlerensis]|uniref:FAD-binding oxidoreductase n=1 Tax=Pallidibacillus pasinlerensis TaxID=2703818 RepID=A0ABX0A4M8_9BACI|nr:FAD-binding oxidoreductase [Pallidibacillus pasinlerensis]NCU18326.1 FAD-binding oxidoreductase [Pallidibacillus pasinlerensis]